MKIRSIRNGAALTASLRPDDQEPSAAQTGSHGSPNGRDVRRWSDGATRHNELTLKMGGWRSKSNPLRVTVDGKFAYIGTTPRSLGYVTLPLKPTPGKTDRIVPAGDIEEKDGFGMVEVTGKKFEDARSNGGNGILEIVEAEIDEPVNPFEK